MGIREAGRRTSRRFWGLAIVALLIALAMPMGRASAAGPQTVGSVSLALTPSSIRADGTSTSTAKATVTDTNGAPVALATVNFGTDKTGAEAVKFSSSSAMTQLDGTASVTITSSTTVDVQMITASTGGKSGSAQLTQFGPATTVTVALNPTSIVANGSSTSTATATAKDANGTGVADENMAFTTSGDVTFGSVTNHGDGTYTTTITSSKTADVETIKATASKEANLNGTAPLTETAGPATQITLQLSKNPIVADGADTSTATATVKDANSNAVTNETVAFTTSGDVTFGSVTNHGDGTYTATITASKTADQETITAKATKANISATQKLTETPGNPTSVTVTLNPSTIKADGGTSSSTATATVKDANGNLVKDETVTFKSSDAGQVVSTTTNNGDGTYTATIKSSNTPGQSTITATTSKHATASGTATLTQFSTANTTTLVLAPSLIPADGATHSTATATVKDASKNPVANAPVNFSTNGDVTFSQTTVNTDSSGNASTQITASHTADKETITAVGGGHTGTATLTESGPATKVALALQPSTVVANGTDTSTATATVTDANNNPVPDETVTIKTGGDATIGSVTNHGDGTYTATITASKTADVETITATATKANKSGQAQLTETAGPASSVTVALNPPSITADGTSTSTATATVKDANGNLVAGDAVGFTTSGDAKVGTTTDNGDGTYRATITASTTADQETITATDTSVNPSKSGSAPLTETAGPASSVTLGLNPSSLTADGTSTSTATATLKDAHNNPVTNETVTITTSGDAKVSSVTNHNDGTYTATITASKTADTETITATATKAGKSATAPLTENPGPAVLNLTLTPSSIPADGKSTSTATASVKDANGNPYPSEAVTIKTSGDANVSSVTNHNDGTYTATITASITADQETITAGDAAKSLTKTATLTETPAGTGFHSLPPTRFLDTRTGGGPLQPNSQRTVQITGQHNVPATHVSAVVLNLTATQASTQTYLTVFPEGTPPNASNLNIPAGRDAANLVTSQVAPDGSVQLYNAAGTVHAIFDVVGYYDDGTVAGAPHYAALTPARIFDTRPSNSPSGPNSTRKVQITGLGGVPTSHVSAVVVNVTGVQPTSGTYLTVFPSGTPPTASNINLLPGEIRPNLVMVPVAQDGTVEVYNALGNTHIIFDVTGYFDDGSVTTAKGFTAHAPVRILDTRDNFALGPGQSKTVTVVGNQSPVPSGATAVVINVTATRATNGTFLTVYPQPPRPTVSNLNVPPATDIPNLVVATMASDGTVQLYNDQGSVDAIFDVVGWFG